VVCRHGALQSVADLYLVDECEQLRTALRERELVQRLHTQRVLLGRRGVLGV
jgi:hypothetical protein